MHWTPSSNSAAKSKDTLALSQTPQGSLGVTDGAYELWYGDHTPPQHGLFRLSQALDSQTGVQLERALHVEVCVGVWKGNISYRGLQGLSGPAEVWKGWL